MTPEEYFNSINKYPKISSNDEILKILKSKPRKAAIEEITLRNLRLVFFESLKWNNTAKRLGIELLDIVQAGNTGLFLGTKKFNPIKGTYLNYVLPYSRSYINAAIFKYSLFTRYSWEKYYKNSKVSLNPVISLSTLVYKNDNGDSILLEDIITTDELPEDLLNGKLIINKILQILRSANGKLHPLGTKIIEIRYGIGFRDGYGFLSFPKVRKELQNVLSEERMRQIEAKAFEYLREHWTKS